MPDLLTHLASAAAPATFLRDRPTRIALLLGALLPDVVSKPLYWVTWSRMDFLEPCHSLPGLLILSYAASLFFEVPIRRRTFPALYAGSLLHVALDLMKDNMGTGSASLFYPFSTQVFELGWIDPENVIALAPAALALWGLAFWIERRVRRVPQ